MDTRFNGRLNGQQLKQGFPQISHPDNSEQLCHPKAVPRPILGYEESFDQLRDSAAARGCHDLDEMRNQLWL
jgi:hypothetical protein